MKSHTGYAMYIVWGLIHSRLSKQKLNMKICTEAEIFRLSDYVPFNIFISLFMEGQGCPLKSYVPYQDNRIAIFMERNGRSSCNGNSCNVFIGYFFVKDKQDKDQFSIDYCPTWKILDGYFTKPLKGILFNVFRKMIVVWKHASELWKFLSLPYKERVGKIDEVENTIFHFK